MILRSALAALFLHLGIAGLGSSSIRVYDIMVDGGAVGGNLLLDTAALQNGITAAYGPAGSGIVYIPPNVSCFSIKNLNATSMPQGIILVGNGSKSCLEASGQDPDGNWMDWSGSNNVQWRDFRLADDGVTTPKVNILWACTGSLCGTSFSFDHIDMQLRHSVAGVYAYGFGDSGVPGVAGGSLNASNARWVQVNNGPNATASNYPTRNSLLNINCDNPAGITSAFVVLAAPSQQCWGPVLTNLYLIDNPGLPGPANNNDNNTTLVLQGVSNFVMNGGALECECDSDLTLWKNVQGALFNGVQFLGVGVHKPNNWVVAGGGLNTFVTFNTPFWSTPFSNFIAIDQANSAGVGGFWGLVVINNNVAGDGVVPFIGKTASGCGPFPPANNWIDHSSLDFYAAITVISCGAISFDTILKGVGAVSVPLAGSDHSHHF